MHAVVGVVDALDTVGFQLADLLRGDGATAAAKNADVRGIALLEHVDHVLEVLDVTTLVGGQRDGIGIFLQGRADDFLDGAVVAEMDHFGTLRLDQAAHDVDSGVVSIKQAGGGDETQRCGIAGGRAGRQGFGGRAHGGVGIGSESVILTRCLWLPQVCRQALPTTGSTRNPAQAGLAINAGYE